MKFLAYIRKVAVLCCMALPFSCTDYLSIQPENEFLEEGVFSSITSIHNTLNGIYLSMANTNSYGGHMTMLSVDLLAQYYNTATMVNVTTDWGEIADYTYDDIVPQTVFSSMWSTAYNTILNINNFITQLPTVSEAIIAEEQRDILLGEAYGLRAFHHFDILRLYGPIYATSAGTEAIPYVSEATVDISPLLPANVVIDSVIADLNRAEAYLINDPVRTVGGSAAITGLDAETDFYNMRSRRLNYFAVLALHARVSLYAGDTETAQYYADQVIQQTASFFTWGDALNTQRNAQTPDRIFSSEVLFGLENVNLYATHDAYFSSSISANNIFTALPERLTEIFSNTNDYRYISSWYPDQSSANPSLNTFYKFDEVEADNPVYLFQPLIRLSEMYYIMTECTGDLTYLNLVRANRGLIAITDAATLDTEIRNEYRREFWGEGQTFFYFKRKNLSTIPDGESTDNVSMTAAQYVVPLPLTEINYR